MQSVKTIKETQTLIRDFRAKGKTIGFVPTMGALHDGHLSLVKQAKKENDIVVVSIFVNPTQFGPKEDFNNYPRDIDRDLNKLSPIGVDVVFIPDVREMYPQGFSTSINIGSIGEVLCGASRAGHFNGVATVVAKLFNIVMPHKAYFGHKDFQQTVVIKKLVRELNFDIDIIVCPTVRERDGLAMSSRNSYLNDAERKAAGILYKALKLGEELISKGIRESSRIKTEIEALIRTEPLAVIEYAEIVDAATLEKIDDIKSNAAICLAVRISATRLIDNLVVALSI